MFIRAYSISIICSAIFLNGCSFPSKVRTISPYFDGRLTYNNKAIDNAKIMLSTAADDKFCLKARKFASTSEEGEFQLKAQTEDYTYVPFADKQLDEWTLCVKYNNEIHTLYSNNRYGPGNVSGSIYLQCDLALNPSNKPCTVSHL